MRWFFFLLNVILLRLFRYVIFLSVYTTFLSVYYFCWYFYRFLTDDSLLYRSIRKQPFPPPPIFKVTSYPNGKFRSAVSRDFRVSSFLRNGFVKSISPSTSCFTILRMRECAKERRFISRQPSLPVPRHERSRRSRCTCIDALVAHKKGRIRVGGG